MGLQPLGSQTLKPCSPPGSLPLSGFEWVALPGAVSSLSPLEPSHPSLQQDFLRVAAIAFYTILGKLLLSEA